MKRKSLLLLIPLAVVGLAGCSPVLKPCEEAVITYKDGATSMTISVNETKQVPFVIEGEQCSGQINWTSSDESVVTIDSDGKVTGHKEGTAVIKANGVSEFTVKVEGTGPSPVDPIVSEILSVKSAPTTVNVNETISASQVILNVKMSDNTECTKVATSVICDTSKAAESVEATAYYDELSIKFNVKVVAQGEPVYGTEDSPISVSQALTTISIDCPEDTNLTKQAIYCTGEVKAISKSGVYDPGDNYFELTATDGTSDILVYRLHATDALKDKVVEGATIKWVGFGKNFKGTLEFVDNGKEKCTLLDNGQPIPPEKEVSSIEVKGTPKTEYLEGQSFDGSQMKLLVHYSDGSSEEISSGWTVSPSGALAATDKVVTISYGGKTTTVNVDVTARELLKIEVTKFPNKTSYYAGDKFDPSGMVVTATYNFGDPATITNYDYSPKGDLTLSDTSIDIVYEGKHASVAITVTEKPAPVSCNVEYNVKNDATTEDKPIVGDDVLSEMRAGLIKGDDILSAADGVKIFDAPDQFKLGSGSVAGLLELTLSKDVTKIVIGAKAFKDTENKLIVNNHEIELSVDYDRYSLDVSATKKVEIQASKRAYLNYFGFVTEASGPVVKSVTVSPKSATVEMESTKQLVATVEVDGGASKDVTWTSSNTAVATVNENGVVTPVSVGKATITVASAVSGFADKKDTCEITVIAKQQPTVESISLDKTACSVEKDGTVLLKATVIAVGGASEQVTWGSSNESIATVNSSGLVTGIAVGGPVTITATSVGDPTKSATCSVTVTPKQEPVVESVLVTSETGISVFAGNSIKLKAIVVAKGGASESVTWKSSNESIATVDQNGLVNGVSEGPVTITATSVFNTQVSGSLDITVLPKPADATFVAVTSANDLVDGMSFTLVGTYNDADYALSTNLVTDKKYIKADKVTVSGTGDKTIKLDDGSDVELFTLVKAGNYWSIKTSENKYLIASGTVKRGSNNTNYIEFAENNTDPDSTFSVTFEGGLATFESQGDAKSRYILFNYNQGKNPIFSCYTAATTTIVAPVIYKVNAPATPEVKSITFDPNEVEVELESSIKLVPHVDAVGGASEEVSWLSSDESVAKVDQQGNVEPVAIGEAVITATSKAEGFTNIKGECKVTVVPKTEPSVEIVVSPKTAEVEVGKSVELTAKVTAKGGASNAVTWESSDTSKARVDSNGLVTGVAEGSVTITAKSTAPDFENVKDTATVTVKAAPQTSETTLTFTGYNATTGSAFSETGTTGASMVASGSINGYDNSRGIQWSKCASTVNITDLPSNIKIKKITVDASSNGTGVVLSAKVAGSAFGSDVELLNENHASAVFEGSIEGSSITISGTAGSKSTYILSVAIEWESVFVEPKVNSVEIDPSSTEVEIGIPKTLRAIVDATGGATDAVTWSSSDDDIATVDSSGTVTAKATGNVTISATSAQPGFETVKGECAVTVIEKQDPSIKGIVIDPSTAEVEVDGSVTLQAKVDAKGGADNSVTWSSSDDTKAIVNAEGVVTGKVEGTVTITATSNFDNTTKGTATVTVKPKTVKPITVQSEIKDIASTNSWDNSVQYTDFNIDDNISVSVNADSDDNSGKYYSSDQSWRIYANENRDVSITAANGYKIQSVTILYSIKDSGVLVYDGEEYESGTAINVDSLTEFVFSASSTSGSSGKVLIKSIIVTYSK